MGGACGCCGDDTSKRDGELDRYLNKYHREKHKIFPYDKKDFFLGKQDLQIKTFKGQKQNEILDEISRKQDLETDFNIKEEFLIEIFSLVNENVNKKKVNQEFREKDDVDEQQELILNEKYNVKTVEINLQINFQGEYGEGGKPLKRGNPYLEIDLIDPTDQVLFEGEIQKFKPGFQAIFIDRWVQLTKKSFRYFVSKPGKDNPYIKPLLAIPIDAISNVQLVDYDLNIKKNDTIGQELAKHQFAFLLKEDFVDYYLSSEYERHFSPDGKRVNTAIQFLERSQEKRKSSPTKKKDLSVKERYILEEENQLEAPLSMAAMNTLNTQNGAWSNREEKWVIQDRRLLFATKTEESTNEWIEVMESLINQQEI